ncbi:MAG: hypothetical protein QGG46_05220 [Gammaproteobacteria bacterium]|nr:hypothetical protein [Gammaproteobacteria bacterium]
MAAFFCVAATDDVRDCSDAKYLHISASQDGTNMVPAGCLYGSIVAGRDSCPRIRLSTR